MSSATPLSNYDLIQGLSQEGRTLRFVPVEPRHGYSHLDPLELDDYDVAEFTPVKIEVVEDDSYSGQTHHWALAAGLISPHDVEYHDRGWRGPTEGNEVDRIFRSRRHVVAYRTERVYGGPEEGGWWKTLNELHTVVFLPDDGCSQFEHDERVEKAKEILRSVLEADGLAVWQPGVPAHEQPDPEVFVTDERVIGQDHTVGSTYYC